MKYISKIGLITSIVVILIGILAVVFIIDTLNSLKVEETLFTEDEVAELLEEVEAEGGEELEALAEEIEALNDELDALNEELEAADTRVEVIEYSYTAPSVSSSSTSSRSSLWNVSESRLQFIIAYNYDTMFGSLETGYRTLRPIRNNGYEILNHENGAYYDYGQVVLEDDGLWFYVLGERTLLTSYDNVPDWFQGIYWEF